MAKPLAISIILALIIAFSSAQYCTFYTDSKCKQRIGIDNYKIGNPHCFTIIADYVKCDNPEQVMIYEYPQGETCGNTPQAAFGFPGFECTNISGLNRQKLQYKLDGGGAPGKKRDLAPTGEEDGLEKRFGDTHCTGSVSFYYGGKCLGPIDQVSEQVTAPGNKVGESTTWTSACHNDGLFSNYELLGSSCDFVVFEGENCSGKSHLVFTDEHICSSITNGKYTLRSWQWSCGQDACNGFKST